MGTIHPFKLGIPSPAGPGIRRKDQGQLYLYYGREAGLGGRIGHDLPHL